MRYLVATVISAVLCACVWGFQFGMLSLEQYCMRHHKPLSWTVALFIGGGKMFAENFFWICVMIFLAVTSLALFLDRERPEKEEDDEGADTAMPAPPPPASLGARRGMHRRPR